MYKLIYKSICKPNRLNPMAHYVNNQELHPEMVKSKKLGELTNKAWKLLTTMVEEGVIRKYNGLEDEDKQDAISSVKYDLCKYWKGFRESGVFSIKVLRNFHIGDYICVKIYGGIEIKLIPVIYKHDKFWCAKCYNDELIITEFIPVEGEVSFLIGENKNKTMTNLKQALLIYADNLDIVVNKTYGKFTFMDKTNEETLSLNSMVEIFSLLPGTDYKIKDTNNVMNSFSLESSIDIPKKGKMKGTESAFTEHVNGLYNFVKPSPAFNYFTSFMENAIRKSINTNKPKEQRHGKIISMSINEGNNGLYNI